MKSGLFPTNTPEISAFSLTGEIEGVVTDFMSGWIRGSGGGVWIWDEELGTGQLRGGALVEGKTA